METLPLNGFYEVEIIFRARVVVAAEKLEEDVLHADEVFSWEVLIVDVDCVIQLAEDIKVVDETVFEVTYVMEFFTRNLMINQVDVLIIVCEWIILQ